MNDCYNENMYIYDLYMENKGFIKVELEAFLCNHVFMLIA